jgi:hypothetical protein
MREMQRDQRHSRVSANRVLVRGQTHSRMERALAFLKAYGPRQQPRCRGRRVTGVHRPTVVRAAVSAAGYSLTIRMLGAVEIRVCKPAMLLSAIDPCA